MEDWQALDVTDEAKLAARRLGMYGNIENRLRRMARDSVPFRHDHCNRRFEGYLLLIKGGKILELEEFSPKHAESRRNQMQRNSFASGDAGAGASKRGAVEVVYKKRLKRGPTRVEQDDSGAVVEFLPPGSRYAK